MCREARKITRNLIGRKKLAWLKNIPADLGMRLEDVEEAAKDRETRKALINGAMSIQTKAIWIGLDWVVMITIICISLITSTFF